MHLMSFMRVRIFIHLRAFMSEPCTVVIGPTTLLEQLKASAASTGEVLAFSDTDALAALETISARRPKVIALERLFAATSRGAASINRIKADPDLTASEIRVLSHDGLYSRVSSRRPGQIRRNRPRPLPRLSTTAERAGPRVSG